VAADTDLTAFSGQVQDGQLTATVLCLINT